MKWYSKILCEMCPQVEPKSGYSYTRVKVRVRVTVQVYIMVKIVHFGHSWEQLCFSL